MMNPPYKFIAVEGVIGVGKTTLATKLAKYYKGEVILEPVEENPFLDKFYKNVEGFAFQTQIFFLFARYNQMKSLKQTKIFFDMLVSDYMFDKDRIFANLNLDENEFQLYEHILKFIEKDITSPDLVIYLQASPEVIMERIKKRSRSFEQDISIEYINELSRNYSNFFTYYKSCPVLIVNVDEVDLSKEQGPLSQIIQEIEKPFNGVKYLKPISIS
ncbi:TPA: deoxynucleoside kinase [candidate division WOR-3 bacterium]|jgi:deoxyadenosine/deoxycytidine kinase|uniref:Deoxynucleoside kinase n=1 Tax=candidate division WOR-3 bacterium TaxID=2052148 RepID=A0A350HB82_UNCW3|nr:deoxynucleoside kinase [candidate division WOR-3 bacterium]